MSESITLLLAQQADEPSPVILLVVLALVILWIASMWAVFSKAGEPGWAAVVPIYNTIVALRVAGLHWAWIFVCLVPYVGSLVVWIMISLGWAKGFNQGTGFAVGLILLAPVFVPILGFGSAQYAGVPR